MAQIQKGAWFVVVALLRQREAYFLLLEEFVGALEKYWALPDLEKMWVLGCLDRIVDLNRVPIL